jgi:hypothetical protein
MIRFIDFWTSICEFAKRYVNSYILWISLWIRTSVRTCHGSSWRPLRYSLISSPCFRKRESSLGGRPSIFSKLIQWYYYRGHFGTARLPASSTCYSWHQTQQSYLFWGVIDGRKCAKSIDLLSLSCNSLNRIDYDGQPRLGAHLISRLRGYINPGQPAPVARVWVIPSYVVEVSQLLEKLAVFLINL